MNEERKVYYANLTPREFSDRLKTAPIAYLPLGTLEYHGEHLPLGTDGLIASGFFERLAHEVGGIILPMLFLGPDRVMQRGKEELYGKDICQTDQKEDSYESRKLPGSAYWISDERFEMILEATLKQLRRAGFRIVVGHGHGPSTRLFQSHSPNWKEDFDLDCLTCWEVGLDRDEMGIQTDHAGSNETSLMMALHPELVQIENLSGDTSRKLLATSGKDPRVYSSVEKGAEAIQKQAGRMKTLLHKLLES